ncbi:Aste57867_1134 [Aphanomyces stellatus]|uniref:Aste57867_1134 protein n=1 Tax=Aphanomyces stellatus TaxID=120398 RepID=A0A485K8L2_9STRA|nr:hypothetical protein As57867_001133 [Aphanomyces stellatus]VFT78354.1 Aste57867_1134 [Aphanomyces stellatus]
MGIASIDEGVTRAMPTGSCRQDTWTRMFGKGFLRLSTISPISYAEYAALSTDLSGVVLDDIRKDISRTNILTSLMEEEILLRILKAYAVRNPGVGYCQGMHILASMFLVHMADEAAVFWSLALVVEELLPDYYSRTMAGVHIDQQVLDILVHRTCVHSLHSLAQYHRRRRPRLPHVAAHLKTQDVDPSLFSTKWFVSVFVHTLPMPLVLRFWDAIAAAVATHANATADVAAILHGVALALLRHQSHGILDATDAPAILQSVQALDLSSPVDQDAFAHLAFATIESLQPSSIHAMRLEYQREQFVAREAAERLKGREAQGWAIPLPTPSNVQHLPIQRSWLAQFSMPRDVSDEWDISFAPGKTTSRWPRVSSSLGSVGLVLTKEGTAITVQRFVSKACVEKRSVVCVVVSCPSFVR